MAEQRRRSLRSGALGREKQAADKLARQSLHRWVKAEASKVAAEVIRNLEKRNESLRQKLSRALDRCPKVSTKATVALQAENADLRAELKMLMGAFEQNSPRKRPEAVARGRPPGMSSRGRVAFEEEEEDDDDYDDDY